MRSASRCRAGSAERPGEVRDGAHNPDGVAWLREKLAGADYTVCASILADKTWRRCLGLSGLGRRSSPRSRRTPAPFRRCAGRAGQPRFAPVEAVAEPVAAVRRAHELGEPVLVTGSLYLLADLEAADVEAEAEPR
jgi:folylpolyglutamate synthase/dihydropteroate synthase